ncbi:MAG: hypothetical protein LKE30_07960 [Bacteroidales bacterium]|nr:hypothetical protein [Bacteroidales bacterium]
MNNIHYFIEKVYIKTNGKGEKQCANYINMERTDSSLSMRGVSLDQFFSILFDIPMNNIKVENRSYSGYSFNISIKSKGYLNNNFILQDIPNILKLKYEKKVYKTYLKRIKIYNLGLLTKYKTNQKDKFSFERLENSTYINNSSLYAVANYLQDLYNEKIIYDGKDTNLYSFSLSAITSKIPNDLKKIGLGFDSVYMFDTIYMFK